MLKILIFISEEDKKDKKKEKKNPVTMAAELRKKYAKKYKSGKLKIKISKIRLKTVEERDPGISYPF